jgi:hypothetical protein
MITSGFTINRNKEKIIVDGTYNGNKTTYTNNLSEAIDVINVNPTNKKVIFKNMNIVSSHSYGVIYVPSHPNYSNVVIEYNNINFNGIELSCNYYGVTKIVNSVIEVKEINGVQPQRVCDSNRIIVDGKTTINSTSPTNTIFFLNDVIPSYLKIMPDSIVSITTNKELMNGTNRFDLIVGHGSEFLLTTGNGFAITTTHGARNVVIEEMANFTFIEKGHQRVPMWNIFGDFVVKEGASVSILNTYMSTPTDNYNIYFKGTNQKFILDNPKYINIYTKNANVLYTNNDVQFSFKFNRINMWLEAIDYLNAYTIDNKPDFYWYKENICTEINGTITKDSTIITSHNFTSEEVNSLSDITNFTFQKKKMLTVGMVKINIHPIIDTVNVLSGHTIGYADVEIEYNTKTLTAKADENGLFEFNLDNIIPNDTTVKLTTYLNGCFTERKIIVPFYGELTLLQVTENIPFSQNKISQEPLILSKKNQTIITIVDSRINHTKWKLFANFINPMIERSGMILIDSLLFKKFNNEIIKLTTNKKLVYEANNTSENVEVNKITFSVDKGLLLSPNKNLLEDEDYSTLIIWTLEE